MNIGINIFKEVEKHQREIDELKAQVAELRKVKFIIEEIPQMKGTLEALNKLTMIFKGEGSSPV